MKGKSLFLIFLSISTILASGRRFVSKKISCSGEKVEGKSRVECILTCTRKGKLAIYSENVCSCGERYCRNKIDQNHDETGGNAVLHIPVMSKYHHTARYISNYLQPIKTSKPVATKCANISKIKALVKFSDCPKF